MRKYLLSFVLVLCFMPLHGVNNVVCDSLRAELHQATTTADSISILFNLFDCSPRRNQSSIAEIIFQTAAHEHNTAVQLDMLRQLVNLNTDNDSIIQSCINRAKSFPYSNERDATIIFLNARSATQAARRVTVDQCRERINELIKRTEQPQSRKKGTRIELLFAICAYLEQLPGNHLMGDYVQQLGDLLNESQYPLHALTGLYLTQAALTYTATGDSEKAVAADRRLLEHIDELDRAYKKSGRIFRSYDNNRYISYRRMLYNFKALSPEEVEDIYAKCRDLAQNNSELKSDFECRRLPDMYYAMARKDYETALPLLKNEADEQAKKGSRYQLLNILEYIIEAAQAIDDKESLLAAFMQKREMRQDEDARISATQFKELQEIFNNSTERVKLSGLEQEKREAERKSQRLIRMFGIIFLLTLLAFVLYLVYNWRETRKLNKDLAKTNARLVEERDSLQRTQAEISRIGERAKQADRQKEEFIANMSHEVSTPLNAITEYTQLIVDCGDADKKPYLTRFAEVVKLNTKLLQALVNDVLDLASLDRGVMKVEKCPVVIGHLAAVAVDSVKSHVQPGVKLINKIDPEFNEIIITDNKRVLQVLYNLLVNAAKFTPQGSITLDGKLYKENRVYEFTVTDTGIGIPEGKDEVIFERFEKLNRYSQGLGLGLSVSRLIASLLGGEIQLDRTYQGSGSRFIFYIATE